MIIQVFIPIWMCLGIKSIDVVFQSKSKKRMFSGFVVKIHAYSQSVAAVIKSFITKFCTVFRIVIRKIGLQRNIGRHRLEKAYVGTKSEVGSFIEISVILRVFNIHSGYVCVKSYGKLIKMKNS